MAGAEGVRLRLVCSTGGVWEGCHRFVAHDGDGDHDKARRWKQVVKSRILAAGSRGPADVFLVVCGLGGCSFGEKLDGLGG